MTRPAVARAPLAPRWFDRLAPKGCWPLLVCALSVFLAMPAASARNVEPGQLFVGLGLGPGLSVGSRLGTQPADFLLLPSAEFTFNRAVSSVAGMTLGFGGTMPILGRLGLRYRAHDLGIALSPYAQLELAGGGLLRVLGSQLRWVGARLGMGVEYFATARVHFGVGLGVALGSTLGQRPAFYGLFDGQFYLNFALNRAALSQEAAVGP